MSTIIIAFILFLVSLPFVILLYIFISLLRRNSVNKEIVEEVAYKQDNFITLSNLNIGESKVVNALFELDHRRYYIISGLLLDVKGKTSQIDHVIVSEFGIFVIETKSHHGVILGDITSNEWSQSLGKKTYYFQNPISQNESHIKALKSILTGMPQIDYFSCITFTEKVSFNEKLIEYVFKVNELAKNIDNYSKRVILLSEEKDEIIRKIISYHSNNPETKKNHYNKVSLAKENNHKKIQNHKCPRCNGKLVDRKGKYGDFKGCSNYPTCRFRISNKHIKNL